MHRGMEQMERTESNKPPCIERIERIEARAPWHSLAACSTYTILIAQCARHGGPGGARQSITVLHHAKGGLALTFQASRIVRLSQNYENVFAREKSVALSACGECRSLL
jgi:hypothetical protein